MHFIHAQQNFIYTRIEIEDEGLDLARKNAKGSLNVFTRDVSLAGKTWAGPSMAKSPN